MPRRTTLGRWIWGVLIVVAVARMAAVVYSGLETTRGDFYVTLPGAFVEWVNPVLWNSPDLSDSWIYQRPVYHYGPTQYLTLYPVLSYFESYEAIARFLLWAYAAAIALTMYFLWRAGRLVHLGPTRLGAAIVVATAFYFPLHHAYLQREFEVVVLCLTSAALLALLCRRERTMAALIGYIIWYKLLPLAWLPYLILRRWWGAIATVAAVSALLIALAVGVLGVEGLGGVAGELASQVDRRTQGAVMCVEWTMSEWRVHAVHNTTWADARWALCSLADRWPWLPASFAYASLLLLSGGMFLAGFVRLERGELVHSADEAWRRGLELGLIVLASSALVHAHYYYLSLLLLPLVILLARYLGGGPGQWWRRTLWMVSYLSLAVFAVPISVLSRLTGIDFWWAYMLNTIYFPGVLLLIGLLLWEYLTIPLARPVAVEAAA